MEKLQTPQMIQNILIVFYQAYVSQPFLFLRYPQGVYPIAEFVQIELKIDLIKQMSFGN